MFCFLGTSMQNALQKYYFFIKRTNTRARKEPKNLFCKLNFAKNLRIPNNCCNFALVMKKTISLLICALVCAIGQAQEQTRYVGGDISMLPKYEQYNSAYKDAYGNNISDLLTWFVTDCGWNTFRVRIFVNPENTDDPAVCQDLAYVTALGKRIKDAGAYFMLDFHYSDNWVDAGKIAAPKAWKGLSDELMADSLGNYTHRVLQTLKAAGATPDLVQVGNEIMYGLCDRKVHPYNASGDNWNGYLMLLRAGCNAVREECPNAQIIIHTDRATNGDYNYYYYKKLKDNQVDYDIIGLSFYPFWHLGMTPNSNTTKEEAFAPIIAAINRLAQNFPEKRVQIVEMATNFQWFPTDGVNYNSEILWPGTVKGQYDFVKDMVDYLKPLANLDGLNYWFPEEAGNGDYGTVMTGWLNRGFWKEEKSTSGHSINKTATPNILIPAANVCAPYYMKNFLLGSGEGIDETREENIRARKYIQNGQIVIERNGRPYSADGRSL